MKNKTLQRYLTLASVFILFLYNSLNAQVVSPYSLSPDWYFGGWLGGGHDGARLTFPTGNFPTSASPNAGSMPTNNSNAVEASTSVCFSDGNVALYSNTLQVYNGNPANTSWNDHIRNLTTDGKCAGSSTGGAVAFPDPASPTDAFYLILGNDQTGGTCQFQGVNRYRFTGTGTTVAYNAGPDNMATDAFAGEAITAGTDGAGGYWVVIHNRGTANTFRVWHFTAGGITGPTDYTEGAAVPDVYGNQSYLKISPCQDQIAYHASPGTLVIHSWDRTTGVVGPELRRVSTGVNGTGVEFSPDGSRVYYSGQGTVVNYVDIASGTTGSVAGSASWSMQLGPDGKIYTSGVQGSTVVGVISDPNTTPTYSTIPLPGTSYIFRGLNNIVWLTPNTPTINQSVNSCTVDFSYVFQNYFLADIDVDPTSIVWDFDDGNNSNSASPTHTYASDGTYDVTLTFNDATCGHAFTATSQVTVSCGITPPGCNYNLTASIDPISDIEIDDKTPVTINFIGSNSIFDASLTDAEKYYWINGSADTSLAFATTANTSLTFAYKGAGGNLPQGTYEIYLVTREGLCMDTIKVTFDVTYFYIPNLVTPNGDPYNERFEITNTAGRFDVEVFNRWGEKIYHEKGYTKNWDLNKVSEGIYYYEVADIKSGKKYKGWVHIVR